MVKMLRNVGGMGSHHGQNEEGFGIGMAKTLEQSCAWNAETDPKTQRSKIRVAKILVRSEQGVANMRRNPVF